MSGLSDDEKLQQLAAESKRLREQQNRSIDREFAMPDPKRVLDEQLQPPQSWPTQPQVGHASDEPFECAICDWRMELDECSPNVSLCAQHLEDVWHHMAQTILREHIPDDQLHARMENVHRSLQNWLPWHGSVYSFGPTGVGKSHDHAAMAKRAWVEWRKRFGKTPSIAWVNVPDFMEEVLDSFGTNVKVNTKWRDADILVLEDIGMGDDKPFAVRKLYTVLDRRSQRRRHHVTLISSNADLDELAVHLKDDRIPSRIDGMCAQVSYVGMPDRRSSMGPTLQ